MRVGLELPVDSSGLDAEAVDAYYMWSRDHLKLILGMGNIRR